MWCCVMAQNISYAWICDHKYIQYTHRCTCTYIYDVCLIWSISIWKILLRKFLRIFASKWIWLLLNGASFNVILPLHWPNMIIMIIILLSVDQMDKSFQHGPFFGSWQQNAVYIPMYIYRVKYMHPLDFIPKPLNNYKKRFCRSISFVRAATH